MYATCTFCHRALGGNESIEVFPVGKRLAFDAGKGRLWVICAHCHRWNLTPLEERWEAIEQAERLFRESKLRHNTDNIGLAKLVDGTELIRIGKPLRPEMAVWRYGQNFVRRWKGMAIGGGAGAVAAVAGALVLPGGFTAGIATSAFAAAVIGAQMFRMGGKVAFLGRVVLDNEHQYVLVTPKALPDVRLISHENGWALRVPYQSRRPNVERHWDEVLGLGGKGHVTISGQAGLTAASQLLPLINGFGARQSVVSDAVSLAGSWGSASAGFAYSLSRARDIHLKQILGD
ncbi:MAG: hypothetical protein H7Z40_05865, partial [Phycisphaerae bacterium]|nr:hypothetical protein [Gemmatimonadaceae bacterium]